MFKIKDIQLILRETEPFLNGYLVFPFYIYFLAFSSVFLDKLPVLKYSVTEEFKSIIRVSAKKQGLEMKRIALYIGNAFQIDISLSLNLKTFLTGQSG